MYASIEQEPRKDNLSEYVGRRIAGSFIFPAPAVGAREVVIPGTELDQDEHSFMVGAMQLGLHFRVGSAGWEQTGIGPRFRLMFGLNEVWRSDCGFCHTGPGLLSGKRTLGSQKVDVMAELDGIGRKVPYPQFE